MGRGKRFGFTKFSILIPAILLFTFLPFNANAAETPSFSLMDAGERTVTKTGSAKGSVTPTYDSAAGKDVLELNYSLAQGSVVVLSAKNFPVTLGATLANTAAIGIKVPEAEASRLSIKAELRGTIDTQTIPVRLKAGWNSIQQPVDWKTIGNLNEVAFIISPVGTNETVVGSLSFALDFIKRAPPAVKKTEAPVAAPKPAPATVVATPVAPPAPPAVKPTAPLRSSYNLLDAGERGTSNEGSAKGNLVFTFDEALGKDVLELDYTVSKGTAVNAWIKKFPSGIEMSGVNTIRLGIKVPGTDQLSHITTQLEIKGTRDTQIIPLNLKRGWNSLQEPVDWKKIGNLDGVIFVIKPVDGVESARGILSFSFDFVKSAGGPKTTVPAGSFTPAFNILDAGARGVFNIGPSQGTVAGVFDESAGKDICEFQYSIPKGSVVGVWTQSYPADLGAKTADAVRIGVRVPDLSQLNQVAVKVEIKGKDSMQTIPLILKPGWNYFQEAINWKTIGGLKEAVFVVMPISVGPLAVSPIGVSPLEIGEATKGTLYFDLEFGKLTFVQKYFTFIKVGLAALIAFLIALLSVPLVKLLPQQHAVPPTPTLRLKDDFFYGMVAVLIGGCALFIYWLGTINALDLNFTFAVAGFGGVFISELLKFKLTGKHLTTGEVFQNALLTGLLAASASQEEVLQAPASWGQVLTLSHLTAALVFVIYHIGNTYTLAFHRKHLNPIGGAMILGTPFLFGWILLLQNSALLQMLTKGLTFGLLSQWPHFMEILGRFFIVFSFNQIVINAISLATKGKFLTEPKAHGFIGFVSLSVALSPEIGDLGSTSWVGGLPVLVRAIPTILATALSFAGLWGETYLMTGVILDGVKRKAPSFDSVSKNITLGMKKGLAYSAIVMAILYVLKAYLDFPLAQTLMRSFPIGIGILAGALVFPFIKTIIETFDGSIPFFERVRYSYRHKTLYARGAVVGFGFAYMVTQGLFQKAMPDRILFGLIVGLFASAGISILRDAYYASKGQGRIQSWRLYLMDSFLGIFIGSAMAFYLDSRQIPVIIEKFKLYTSAGFDPVEYITYPLVNKWGRIDLGTYTGGAKLIFTESVAGVINWSIAAWLFAINKVLLEALFQKNMSPIKFFFSKAGFVELVNHMLYVLRWGLWMSPIIFTFLRMMPDPTWYNQDGAVRTMFAIYHNVTSTPQEFQAWSLNMFIYVMAFDFFRVLIWMDHMGLRVASLVNLSFIGLDRLDEKIAKFIGPAVAQRYIPEGVKRFATWAPLLIPFYLPRGEAWDYAWSTAESIQNAARGKGLLYTLGSLSFIEAVFVLAAALLVCTGASYGLRLLSQRAEKRRIKTYHLDNREYKVVVNENGGAHSEIIHKEFFDLTRRTYDIIDPAGRILFVVDKTEETGGTQFWPVIGNFPKDQFAPSLIEKVNNGIRVVNTNNGIKTTVTIELPDLDAAAELWTIKLENLTTKARQLKVVPYLEWLLNGFHHDRFHTQYQRLFPEMEYVREANAILAWQKGTKAMGILASDVAPEGFHNSRMDFVGRAQSIWAPRIFDTFDFLPAKDTAPYPTFDPIGTFVLDASLNAKAVKTIQLLVGQTDKRKTALELIHKHLKTKRAESAPSFTPKNKPVLIGHGEILPGTPEPYSEFIDNGKKLLVHTPFTPRPYDHAMSNEIHSVMVTNRGLHTSCNGNSQQNRLTPDWPDTVTKEIPTEAIYIYDVDDNQWYSPTYHPLNQKEAVYQCEFGVDGTSVFRMTNGPISTELTVFVPPGDPAGVYLLTVRNNSSQKRRLRIAPYFQMVLSFMSGSWPWETSGPLEMQHDKSTNALYFLNRKNMFRVGWAFAAMSLRADQVETKRGRFFGQNRGVKHPYMVQNGEPDANEFKDNRQIAGFIGTMELAPHGESTVSVVLGQTDAQKDAAKIVAKYKNVETAKKSLNETRTWWLSLMETADVQSNHPQFDRLQHWLKYQALAERIWARRGFYQTSGAFGFRDQLQDTVNLMWVDPALARKQIILHASHQFVEGDVYHWFFTLTDGRSAFSCRSHASDNPVWLSWALVEYVKATSDYSILDELASYAASEFPFAPLPKNKQGWGHIYHRSTKADTIYKHCLKSIDLVLEKRTGKHGLPLMGTGDWNDGLDEIGSEGRGESVWLGLFVYYILKNMLGIIERKDGVARREHYARKLRDLGSAIERTWRGDRYLRAIHDDGTEIGVKGSGIWEIDSLTAAWAVMAGINFERGVAIFDTAVSVLEKQNAILLGWPALREDTKPYLGRSSKYPEGVRENGMYCHGVQWMVRAARILAEQFADRGDHAKAGKYRETAYRLWLKISAIPHTAPGEIEIYGGQPNKQAADILTNFDVGRMIWHGYTGAAGWMLRQAFEGVVGASIVKNELVLPSDLDKPRGELQISRVARDVRKSPISAGRPTVRPSSVTVRPPEIAVTTK